MEKQLYFDINSEESGGSLYRIKDDTGKTFFQYNHSIYNADSDEIKIFETIYSSFNEFWQMLTKDAQWFYQHPLYIHPEQRDFIKEQLQKVNWPIEPNKKWQDSHQRQWKKVLEDRDDYYRSRI